MRSKINLLKSLISIDETFANETRVKILDSIGTYFEPSQKGPSFILVDITISVDHMFSLIKI
ncbi:hypothetical protein LEP1GSC047_4012 [Leptospira inadai serovar Lyme str. 10]|uniref:Uncharacterized protein n=2 Tax=Leptospira inadai serovar Lyme TaxID=293084 RepID=V6HEK7_9LEPT|nr:hypothetical protein LEP1GSC047_4012 [Leptospira inadai serovar Lyme str. 10]PNV71904.1 hypothetical protein BES34_020610 [Leptospira inadai serovar Lyme]